MNNSPKKLDARLNAIVCQLRPSDLTADVGCDHGLLSLFVLKSDLAKRVLCTDISAKCLQKTKNLLSRAKLENRAKFLVCDGLLGVEDPVDQIVIAGMGGQTICNILENLPQHLKHARLVLQPMNNPTFVRKTLNKLGKRLTRDEIVFDKNKYYHILCAEEGKQVLSQHQIRCGAITEDYRSADYQKWLGLKIAKVTKILEGIDPQNPRYSEMSDYLQSLKKCIF